MWQQLLVIAVCVALSTARQDANDLADLEKVLDKLFGVSADGTKMKEPIELPEGEELWGLSMEPSKLPKEKWNDLGDFNITTLRQIEMQVNVDAMDSLEDMKKNPQARIPHRKVQFSRFGAKGKRYDGLKAVKKIEPGELFMSVGTDDMMIALRPHPKLSKILYECTDSVLEDKLWKAPGTPFTTMWLTINLMFEKSLGKQSHYYPYISTLPKNFTSPTEWSKEDLKALEGTSLYSQNLWMQTINHITWYADTIPRLVAYAPDLFADKQEFFTEHEFLWAMNVVSTRAFGFPFAGTHTKVLVPLVDKFNHGTAPTTWDFAFGKFVLIAGKEYQPGEEVTISYGNLNNAHLLEHYGFTLPVNNVQATPRSNQTWPKTAIEMHAALKEFKTTMEEDFEISTNPNSTLNQHNAAMVRIEERQALLGIENKTIRTRKSGQGSSFKPYEEVLEKVNLINEDYMSRMAALSKD